jgi:hypothetical protein
MVGVGVWGTIGMFSTVASARLPRALGLSFVACVGALSLAACGGGGGNSATNSAAASTPTHFVNAPADAKSPTLSANFVDFSFDYPSNWTVDPETGTATASNFIKVERNDPSGLTIENFAVGEFKGTGDADQDAAQMPDLLGQLEHQVSTLAGYKRVSTDEATTVNGLSGYQLTFSATPQIGDKPGNLFGRMIIVPQPGTSKGVVLIMLGTDISGELHSVADLGVKGQLPMILNSFKFPAAAPAADTNAASSGDASSNSSSSE